MLYDFSMDHTRFKQIFTIVGMIFIFSNAFSQKKYTISGYVYDASNGEALIGANVYIKETLAGITTNNYGFYSLTVPEGAQTLVCSYLGYKSESKALDLKSNQSINFEIKSLSVQAGMVEVTDDKAKAKENTNSTKMGTIELEMEDVKKLPVLFGEVDILKTIQLLPGVQSGGEGTSGLYVRGGGPDQNLILLDGAPVYNVSHLFGFFSVFNGDAIKNVNLIKGGMPSQYGGRLSSVLDITMKDGNNKRWEVEGGIGLIASRLTFQGPIVKDKLSVIVSARRTYADVIAKPFIPSDSRFAGSGYYFYDVNAKINWKISNKDRIFLSGYFGRDVFDFNSKESGFTANMKWGNATTTLRWNHVYNQKLFSNVTLLFTDYNFAFDGNQNDFNFNLYSGIRDYGAKVDFNYYPTTKHDVKFGLEYTNHTFSPSNVTFASTVLNIKSPDPIKYHTNDLALYIGDDWTISNRFKINAGLRFTYNVFNGKFTRYEKNADGATIDTIFYKPGQKIKDFARAEPRISGRFAINENSSIKASYTMNYQYIQLASRSTISLPLDVWLPSTDKIVPQFSQQVAVGYYHNFFNDQLETSIEVYYKPMQNLIEFADGADPAQALNNNIDNNLVQGSGRAYGAEFFIKKSKGKLNGWIGYTLAWTTRDFPTLNNGKEFWAKYDRRHDLSIVLNYEFTKRLSLSFVFVYASGNTLTLPASLYFLEGKLVTEFGDRNSYRFAPYHRADLALTYVTSKPTKRFKSSLTLSVYNVYSRQNPFFIYYDQEGNLNDGTFKLTAKQVSLFPIIPSLTWNFKF